MNRDIPAIEGGTPVRDDFLVFGRPDIREAEIQEMTATLRSGWIGSGPRTQRFEEAFAAYQEVPHAVALSSCTAALHLSLIASNLRRDAKVLVPAMTFAATANAVIHAGGHPVFVDVDRETWQMDLDGVEKALQEDARRREIDAVVPVHFAGRPLDMDRLSALGKSTGVTIISDAAHAIESRWKGKPLGSCGETCAYSFYVTKNMTTGEGGMVTTHDPGVAARIRTLALHGLSHDAWHRYGDEGFKHYQVVEAGFKYNFTDMQAALGIHQLARLDKNHSRRGEIWSRYDAAFAGLPVQRAAPRDPGSEHARHLYILLLDLEHVQITRDRLLEALHRENIGTGVHYVAPPLQPYFQEKWGTSSVKFPVAEWLSERTFSLPLSSNMSDRDVDDVITALSRILTYYG